MAETLPTPFAADDPERLLADRAWLVRIATALLGDKDEAEDLAQEVQMRALASPPRAGDERPWLRRVAQNLAMRWRARRTWRANWERGAARNEREPSSAELVARVQAQRAVADAVLKLAEPDREVILLRFFDDLAPAAIAARLKLPVETVRTRLKRALARLRERLDAKSGGDRGQWVAALAPAALGFGVTGVSGAAIAAAVVVALAATATVWFALPDRDAASRRAEPREVALERAAATARLLAAAPLPPQVEAARASETAPSSTEPAGSTPTTRAIGHLRFAVVDEVTSQMIPSVKVVRALSPTRVADVQGTGPFELDLTADIYDLVVSASGFEPESRPTVRVEPNETVDLGTIALGRGTGVIRGVVRSPALAADVRRFVELRGDGRSPCPRCASLRSERVTKAMEEFSAADTEFEKQGRRPTLEELEAQHRRRMEPEISPSLCCGYSADRSLVEVDASGRFEFSGLGAGTYFIRALDATPRLQPTMRIELERCQSRLVELALAPEVSLCVRLRDAAGAPYVGRWKNDWSEETAPIHLVIDVDGVLVPIELTVAATDVWARFGAPPHLGDPPPAGEKEAIPRGRPDGSATKVRLGAAVGRTSMDRPRDAPDPMMQLPPTPAFAGVEYAVVGTAPGEYIVNRMPAGRVRVRAACCGASTSELELDLADPAQRSATLVFPAK